MRDRAFGLVAVAFEASREMDDFAGRRHYIANRFLMTILGLWPDEHSLYTKLWNAFVIVFLSTGTIAQLIILFTQKVKPQQLLNNFCHLAFSANYLIKYIVYFINLDDGRNVIERIMYDWNSLSDEEELRIINEYSSMIRTTSVYLIIIIVPSATFFMSTIFSSDILDTFFPLNYTRPRSLPLETGYFIDEQKYFHYLAAYLITTTLLGMTIMIATEMVAMGMLHHISGLYKIISYRLTRTFVFDLPRVSPAERRERAYKTMVSIVDLHNRINELVDIIHRKYLPQYLPLVLLGSVGNTLSLYRLIRILSNGDLGNVDVKETVEAVFFVYTASLYAVITNYIAQDVIDHSSNIFIDAYNTEWYRASVSEQKLLLIIMQNNYKELSLVVAGLITISYQGMALILRTTFSYGMVMHSIE